jgi:hypothetical protein
MLTKNQSIQFFLLGCIPVRIIIALLPLYIETEWLSYYSILLFAIAFSFLFLYFFNMRQKAFEAGGITWWANYRIIHGLLYLTAAFYAFNKNRSAWIPLTLDVLIGLSLFIHKRLL